MHAEFESHVGLLSSFIRKFTNTVEDRFGTLSSCIDPLSSSFQELRREIDGKQSGMNRREPARLGLKGRLDCLETVELTLQHRMDLLQTELKDCVDRLQTAELKLQRMDRLETPKPWCKFFSALLLIYIAMLLFFIFVGLHMRASRNKVV